MIVSISRNSASRPRVSRIATIAPIGSPRYNDGKRLAEASPRASRPPFQAVRVSAPSATRADINTTSIGTGRPPRKGGARQHGRDTGGNRGHGQPAGPGERHVFDESQHEEQLGDHEEDGRRREPDDRNGKNEQNGAAQDASHLAPSATGPTGDGLIPPYLGVALLVGHDGFEQVAPAEVGPQRFGHPDLGEYAICHNRKLLTRISPLVRISRSGSGWPAVYRNSPNRRSSRSSAAIPAAIAGARHRRFRRGRRSSARC